MDGTTWDVIGFVRDKRGTRRGDGDTIRIWRTGIFRLGDKKFRLTDPEDDDVSVRLVWVDTPESDEPGYRNAADDLSEWIRQREPRGLRVVCYDGGAGWDRLLADLIDADGNSASQYLLAERNWPYYVRGA